MGKRLIVIAGPTASGKTAAAIELSKKLNTEIVSCDSRQFYEELDIGVARPTPDELAAAKHHFIACRSVTKPYNVFDYEHDALDIINNLFKTHDDVIVVGGSGLYIDAICKGINVMPDPTPELRQELSAKIADGQIDELLAELKEKDPKYYNSVDTKNPIRIQRALEVIRMSGKPYSELIDKELPARPFRIVKYAIECGREELRERINRRTDQMIAHGLLNEAEQLLSYRHLNTLNTVGYKEMFSLLDGKKTLSQAITDIKNHTWQYAKKQITWLKRYPEIIWTDRDKISDIITIH